MAIFSKNESSKKITDKISKLEGKLGGLEDQLAAKKAELEKIYAEGGDVPGKLSSEMVKLQFEADGMKNALATMEKERDAALGREQHDATLEEINRAEKTANEVLDDLDDQAKNLSTQALSLYIHVIAFNHRVEDLAAVAGYHLSANIYGTRELSGNRLLRIFALAGDQGHALEGIINRGGDDIELKLQSVRATIKMRNERLRRDLNEEEVEPPPTATASTKKREMTPSERGAMKARIADASRSPADRRRKKELTEGKEMTRQQLTEAAAAAGGKVVSSSDGEAENVFAERDREDDA